MVLLIITHPWDCLTVLGKLGHTFPNNVKQKGPGHNLGYSVAVKMIPAVLSFKRRMKGFGVRAGGRVEEKDKRRTRQFTGHTQNLAVGSGKFSLSSHSPLTFELIKTGIIKARRT